jgi:hypothetical protein
MHLMLALPVRAAVSRLADPRRVQNARHRDQRYS